MQVYYYWRRIQDNMTPPFPNHHHNHHHTTQPCVNVFVGSYKKYIVDETEVKLKKNLFGTSYKRRG
jgi:hypothetical protein